MQMKLTQVLAAWWGVQSEKDCKDFCDRGVGRQENETFY